MDAADKQALIEKIEALRPNLRERVVGYVDALLEGQRVESRQEDGRSRSGDGGSSEEDRYLQQDWAGALSDLKDEYTSLELEAEIRKEWARTARD